MHLGLAVVALRGSLLLRSSLKLYVGSPAARAAACVEYVPPFVWRSLVVLSVNDPRGDPGKELPGRSLSSFVCHIQAVLHCVR